MILMILTVLEVVLLFNLLIGVHELGHFLAAKWRGLQIDRFAIWFGKPIWSKKIGGVEYALGWIPAGGYVALPQMATMEALEGKSENSGKPLPEISPLDKIIVAFAGPLFSFLLAFGFAVLVWAVGRPVNQEDHTTTIGWVDPNVGAGKAGLRPGDTVLAIDGHPVTHFLAPPMDDSINWHIITSEGTNVQVTYLRNGKTNTLYATPYLKPTKWYQRHAVRQLMIAPEIETVIDSVMTNSPADVAGLRAGDKIVAIDGTNIYSPNAFYSTEASLTNGIRAVTFTIKRDDHQFDCVVHPERPLKPKDADPSFGIAQFVVNTNITLEHPTPDDQIAESAGQIFATIGALTHHNDVGLGQLGGPIVITRVYINLLGSEEGWRRVLWFSVVLNVNLALLNLLPFPVLDGGHITLALLEAIRRRPVSARLVQYVYTACAIALIGFLLLIGLYDASDWASDWARNNASSREAPIEFAPPHR